MKLFLKNNLAVIGTYFIILGIALAFIFSLDKKVIHLYFNQYVGHAATDNFFKYITYLGDGTVAVFLLLGLLIYNFRLGIYATASFLTASLVSIALKHLFFDDENRPTFIFDFYEHYKLKLVDGVHTYIHNSFPSGHSTQAFAIFMCLIFTSSKQYYKFLFLALAVLTAYSRVHLSQHWLADVSAGSVVGFVCSLIYYAVFIGNSKFDKLNKPIFLFLRYWRSR
ncbi:MAG: phosphatase PAP2 family protein [Bacteroidia bacterium]|nr:phosphatase PAP2 family protein [Bacteroidia bacterium]